LDPAALSRFWAAALGSELDSPPEGFDSWPAFLADRGVPEEEWHSASALHDPTGAGPRLYFQQVPESKIAKNRGHLDIRAAPGLRGEERMAALEAECARLIELGATRFRRFEPDNRASLGFIVMQDPEGNEFCLD
ncbi:MAG: VOC family protein, partial [Actinomycetes bacterium]|nr:VOC family protein [Actinomycetes bacterium]MDX5380241.1 VOC family protein [Actinomycetes bacterium]MDX5398941.1 VOC family protein [Actinomycetes bacterium]MDX5449970.1 VOC family protein [Actinomycetes bacterium]